MDEAIKLWKTIGRDALPQIIDLMDWDCGIEVGVQHGTFAEILLRSKKLASLQLVDIWKQIEGYRDDANLPDDEQEAIYAFCKMRLAPHSERLNYIRMLSADAVHALKHAQWDFAYIDADHSYAGAKADIEAYWPLISAGGCLAGHDYLDAELPQGSFGVKRAVSEFAKANGLTVHVTEEAWPSWLIFK